jgi:Universal stress protein family
MKTIVVGYDGSDAAERALRRAADIADAFSAGLVVVSASGSGPAPVSALESSPELVPPAVAGPVAPAGTVPLPEPVAARPEPEGWRGGSSSGRGCRWRAARSRRNTWSSWAIRPNVCSARSIGRSFSSATPFLSDDAAAPHGCAGPTAVAGRVWRLAETRFDLNAP